MGTHRNLAPPFSIQLLDGSNAGPADGAPESNSWLRSLLPASYRTDSDSLATPRCNVTECIERELDLRRLQRIHRWLWVAGRPMPPRALHYQLLLGREIFVTEQMDMHLVQRADRIFLKPVPRFLLEPRVWSDYLSCVPGCRCSKERAEGGVSTPSSGRDCDRRGLRKRALGFLFSYAALIAHESDFFIAVEKRLLPVEVTWPGWRTLVEELRVERIFPDIDDRFVYGELRLTRLNMIYSLSQPPHLRGYMPIWQQYGTFFMDNLNWVASAAVGIFIVLTAMQVGLATSLADSHAFRSASYGFTVFTLVAFLVAFGLLIVAFCYMLIGSWVVTVAYKKRRLHAIQTRLGES
ncbi:Subtilisin-like serine protease [Pleurostoma richardsiae]|uniref:Subtilisin-like serine protease n=1 Tax=Pleurostoma richardsiae TaxID=41990 RepID=A0AA38RCS7_9PEZI|nr:Subtilisin-like serine protease [Pleurostoma richardsiae]